ncbi:helix-turn-helix transcriptional regulator [Glutamicibacter creatinolyticus]|uniref:helix-turn-helix transcriptional regulator n=1 Tax=Glutamicibacter creatinolyticus TaxID=162496 RepID=UPI0032178A2E
MSQQIRIKDGLLDRLRNLTGITSDEAQARMLGVSRATIDRIKNGEQPSAKFMAALCSTYGLGLGEAFEIVNEKVTAAAA